MAKKFDDIKEVISANSTPVKGAIGNATSALSSLITEEDSTDGSSEVNADGEFFRASRSLLGRLCGHIADDGLCWQVLANFIKRIADIFL